MLREQLKMKSSDISLLQKHALNGNRDSFFELLLASTHGEKERKEIMDLCDVKESELKIYQRKKYNKSFGITVEDE